MVCLGLERILVRMYVCDMTDKGGLLQIHLVYVCSEDVDSHTHTQSSMA